MSQTAGHYFSYFGLLRVLVLFLLELRRTTVTIGVIVLASTIMITAFSVVIGITRLP